MKIISIPVIFAALGFLTSCTVDPISTKETGNKGLTVDVIGHVDDCSIYRFHDGGYDHYFVRCGQQLSTIQRLPGKPGHPETIQTVQ